MAFAKRFFLYLVIFTVSQQSVYASSIQAESKETQSIIQEIFPTASFRFDGLFSVANKTWLLLIPSNAAEFHNDIEIKANSIVQSPDLVERSGDDFLFSNGWIYTPIKANSIKSLMEFSPAIQEQIIQNKIVDKFLIPEGFSLPRDLAILAQGLPIKLKNVELATEKEEKYQELLEKNKNNQFNFIAYSNNSGKFYLINITDANYSQKEIPELSSSISWLTAFKVFKGEVFLADYNENKIFSFASKDIRDKNDKIKIKNIEQVLEPFDTEQNQLKDFAVTDEFIYYITGSDNRLSSFNRKKKKSSKQINLPAQVKSIDFFSSSSNLVDSIVVLSKGSNEINFLNDTNYQINHKLKFKKDGSSLVKDFEVSKDFVYIAIEKYKNKERTGEINLYDSISKQMIHSINLDYVPYKLFVKNNSSRLIVLGNDFKDSGNSVLHEYDLADIRSPKNKERNPKELNAIKLGPDIVLAEDFSLDDKGQFLLIPSPKTKLLGIVDLKDFSLVKKINTKDKIHKITFI